MGRNIESVCKQCRREGMKLYLKGARCHTAKCSLEKRTAPPGVHNWRKGKLSEYGKRLREKQKVKRYYGLYERQFKLYFQKAALSRGNTGENLLTLLERRLDNVVYRASFGYSRPHSRQLVYHGHVRVNGKKVDLPSYLVKLGDIIEIRNNDNSKKIVETVQQANLHETPSWIEKIDNYSFKVVQMPNRGDIADIEIHEQWIVEFFSR